jgi:isopentenyl diphosphate isomerase/L-lactate dehydrogenase-like FMN-dependent dehydrogenase
MLDMSSKKLYAYQDWENEAKARLAHEPFTYIQSGAGEEETLQANVEAFRKWKIRPRFLQDVSKRNPTVKLLGKEYLSPFFLAPVGMQGIVHPEGELASARAAKGLKIPFIASSVSTYSMEQIAKELDDTPKWFQLYWSSDWNVTASFVSRAENAGYEAIVVTIDTSLLGYRKSDLSNGYSPLRLGKGAGNYFSDEAFLKRLNVPPDKDEAAAIQEILKIVYEPALSWENLAFLRKHTSLPILLKGILHPEDAKRAMEIGMDGIIVSNHGGRQLDGCISSLDALVDIKAAVNDNLPILIDSGIRSGADIVKAKALGADAVLIGRPYIYGLACSGEQGVWEVLENLRSETDAVIGLSGLRSFVDIDRALLKEIR